MPVSAIASATDIQMDYMKLLITQLQNQDPLEPLNNNEMSSQLAQFSQLQQLESMNSNFAEVLEITNRSYANSLRSYANSLIGQKVTFFTQDTVTGNLVQKEGIVNEVYNDPNSGENLLRATVEDKEYTLGLDAVISVKN
ncbi:MAG TPA: flagellar hook capping FlgD N-terminal domain-containing protein [Sedimentisphaerales bacterium]|nr:flagellar hook capping FlgD N-terminal domain-containing protein [Sedimentisphaerales bacterium]